MALEENKSFPVWVGCLAESVTEATLYSHFKKIGPVRNVTVVKDPVTGKSKQFGYVNYYNHEVAEVAAQEMNGVVICKRKIKTKGPKKLTDATSPLVSPVEPKNMRLLTDCYFFNLRGKCTPKVGQACQYRHSEKARTNNVVCEKWESKTCKNINCPKQHPGPKPDNSVKTKKDVPITRCNSHNAYKCYNQCGLPDCNTHFQSEQDLIDHVTQNKELFSPCSVCNAVFFNKEEKMNHSHKKSKESRDVLPINMPMSSHSEPIGVYWDIENCRVPRGTSAVAVVNKIRERFYPGRREVEFMCVCDTTKEKKEILEELNKAQINIVHINATSKNAADDKLKQALRRFAQTHMPPATIVLVSGDINFASELSDLRHRHNLRVILLHNQQASDALLNCANECENFNQFTSGLPACPIYIQKEGSNEVLITNLPSGSIHSVHKIKGRLNTLANNTGGKVISISLFDEFSKDNVAVMRFPDVDAAQRGVQRLDQENVYGSAIKATFYTAKKTKNDRPVALKKEVYNNLTKLSSKSTPSLSKGLLPHQKNDVVHRSEEKLRKNFSLTKLPDAKEENLFIKPKQLLSPFKKENFQGGIPLNNSIPQNGNYHVKNFISDNTYPVGWLHNSNNTPQNSPQNAGVNIFITNLDESIQTRDMKKRLCSLVREHTKVLSITLENSGENNYCASIKVPSLQDAQLCISKLNNQLLFSKRIQLSLTSMKFEVCSVLQDMCTGWLPINDFLSIFKDRYHYPFHVPKFDEMKDIVYVDGCPGFQFVCLLHFPVGVLKVKQQGNDFGLEIMEILKEHNRRVPFASIPGLYWSYLKKQIPLDENGELLVKIVLNKQICLFGNTPAQQAIFFKKSKEKGSIFPLEDFRNDLVGLLKVSPLFSIPLLKFIPLYHQFFGRQCCTADYGYKDLNELLLAIADTIEINAMSGQKMITFTLGYRQQMVNDELHMLLQAREKHKLPVSSLVTAYYRFFGRKLFCRNFGFPTMTELLNSLEKKFKVSGTGDKKVLTLHQNKPNGGHKPLKLFANEVSLLIKNQPDKRLGLHNLSSEYYKYYGKQLKLAELGFSKLNDLVTAISDYVEICGSRDQKMLYISENRPNFKSLWREVELLLADIPERAVLLLQLPDFYQEKLLKPFPLDSVQMNKFLKNIPSNFLTIGKGAHRIVIENNAENYSRHLLNEQMMHLLYSTEHFKLSVSKLSKLFSEKNIHVNVARINAEVARSEYFQRTKDRCVQLMPTIARKMFEMEASTILAQQANQKMELNNFQNTFTRKYSKVLYLADYGVSKLRALFENLSPGIVQVNNVGSQHWVSLGPLGRLYTECGAVLEENDGALLLCNFAPEYQRKYNIHLKATSYNFSKISDLLESLSPILKVYGEKNKKVVVLKDRVLNPREVVEDVDSQTQSGSDSDSGTDVIIESEEFENNPSASTTPTSNERSVVVETEDLLKFSDQVKDSSLEWWMEPVPDILEPALQPELTQTPTGMDLISFTEFDDDALLNGGLDEKIVAVSQELSNPLIPLNATDSDNFVDHMFSGDIPAAAADQQEPDLMRMLLGRCSPVTDVLLPRPLHAEERSVTDSNNVSSVSETYSFYPALESTERGSYTTALHDVFSNKENVTTQPTRVRPKLAANFNKQ
ncbi:meiosis regulator and mRNA stability factor 1-like isoform X1 [Hydractinia symbiolongicarpus]|uniref:meiosis regulator and mRNA stability factor 1-like isoform X1 n=2 Tax=Hydractinia symbiolongicarpus TaxID=13093 RepID=UPI00254F1972|nr:meiosis regulator and mRNA stability factor 1-like isoform X1 [Hydractinia symbiolongicarpus]